MGKYFLNKETQKIELHFEKSEYQALSDEMKKEIKSAFLWSRSVGGWVSRSTNNHYRANQIAEKLGLENEGKKGERLSYVEELERKTERAEARAERFEGYAGNAEKRAESLQADFNKYRKDWSWLTQPIIAGHSGSRAFANHKNKVMARYEKGFEEYRKSSYYQDRAATARGTASMAQLENPVYLHNRIKEQNKKLKQIQDAIAKNENTLYRIQQGEILHARYGGEIITTDDMENLIAENLEKYDYEYGKLEFFENALSDLGGLRFSQENIKPGYIVEMRHWGKCEIVSTGSVNVQFKTERGGFLTEPYAAIEKIITAKTVTASIENPYTIGDILTKNRSADNSIYKAYQVLKVTKKSAQILELNIIAGIPQPGQFKAGSKPMTKKIVKSKFSEYVGIYVDDWQLHKYTQA